MNFHRKPITFVGNVSIKVQNIKDSLAFYQEVIGFKVLKETEKKVIFTVDGKTPLLSIEQPDNVVPKQPRTTGLYHFALLLPHRADLGRILKHFIEIDYPLQGASDHLVSEAVYLADPDGNGIEIYADRESAQWNWKNDEVMMTTTPLDVRSVLVAGQEGSWKGLPVDTVMGHIHLHVSELKKTEEFYKKGLGLEVVSRYGNQALFMSSGNYHHHIGLNTWNGLGAPAPSEGSVGLQTFTLMLPSREARIEIVSKLKGIGAPVLEEGATFITSDPSGNHIYLEVS